MRSRAVEVGGVALSLCICTVCRSEPATNRPPATGTAVPEIVVTATRERREVQSVPGMAYNLDAARLTDEQAVRTTPELLGGIPSVLVQKTAYGQGSPYLRGFTGFRTLCLVDGVRLNNSVFRDGPNQYWNTVDPLALETCDLVMGPASVLYGSDAVGGAVNATSVAPPDYEGVPTWQRRLSYRGATAEDSHVGRLQFGGRPTEAFGFVGGVSLKDFGDLRGGRDVGKQAHTGYGEQDFDFRADYHSSADTVVTLGHQTVDQDDAWRTHKTIYGIDWEGLAVGDEKVRSLDQHRDLTYLKLRSEDLDTFADAAECTLSRHAQSEDQYRVKKDGAAERQGFDVATLGAVLQFESDSALGAWVYGTEYYRDSVDAYTRTFKADGSFGKDGIQGPVADDATYESLGVYVQDTVAVCDGALEIVPGLRYSCAKVDARDVQDPVTGGRTSVEGDWDALTGSLRFLHPLTRDRRHVVFAGIAQGFRAPNLSDLTRLDTARSNEIETPSPDLDPEDYIACEAGLKSRLDRLALQACVYHTYIDGMIVRTPTGRIIDGDNEVTKQNAGDGYVQGVELTARYTANPNWSTWASGTLMDGRVDGYPTSKVQAKEEYISRLMPPTAEAGLRWQTEAAKYWCELVGNLAAKADKLSADDRRDTQRIPPGGTPGYAVCHVRTGARVSAALSLGLAVENVFDEDYRIHGSGVNEPGRNLILTAACDF